MSIISLDKLIVLYWNDNLCRMEWGGLCESDKEVAAPTSCCYCIIPWPCPPGKNPRAPQVPYQLNGKPCWFTFNLLRHFLRLVCYCWSVPLSSFINYLTWDWPCYSGLIAPALPGSSLRSVKFLQFLGGLSRDWVPLSRALIRRVA
jgi:hypothetical protein